LFLFLLFCFCYLFFYFMFYVLLFSVHDYCSCYFCLVFVLCSSGGFALFVFDIVLWVWLVFDLYCCSWSCVLCVCLVFFVCVLCFSGGFCLFVFDIIPCFWLVFDL
jgi:hypothetical protein